MSRLDTERVISLLALDERKRWGQGRRGERRGSLPTHVLHVQTWQVSFGEREREGEGEG